VKGHPEVPRQVTLKADNGKVNNCFVPDHGGHAARITVLIFQRLLSSKQAVEVTGKVPDMNGDFYLYPIPGLDPREPNSYCVSRMLIGGASPFDKQDFRQSGTIDQAVGLPRVLVFEDNL